MNNKIFLFIFVLLNIYYINTVNSIKPKEESVPCMKEGISDKTSFRSSSSSKSKDMAFAKDKALNSAKQILASLIGSTIQSVTDNYSASLNNEKSVSFKQAFESITKEIVNQQLKNVKIICEKIVKNKDGMYEAFVAVEISRMDLIDVISNKVIEDKQIGVDFDKQKFLEIFDKEMENVENK